MCFLFRYAYPCRDVDVFPVIPRIRKYRLSPCHQLKQNHPEAAHPQQANESTLVGSTPYKRRISLCLCLCRCFYFNCDCNCVPKCIDILLSKSTSWLQVLVEFEHLGYASRQKEYLAPPTCRHHFWWWLGWIWSSPGRCIRTSPSLWWS